MLKNEYMCQNPYCRQVINNSTIHFCHTPEHPWPPLGILKSLEDNGEKIEVTLRQVKK